jgi:uncharacterized membrane protein YbhN (UPF0104 family)
MPSSAAPPTANSFFAFASSLWPHVRRWGLPVFGIIVLGLLASHAHKVDWAGAWQALWRYSPLLLLAVLGLATASHALYGCFDLIGRHHTRHKLVGGVALRVRLYTRAGLDDATIAQIVGISLATNWLGYGLVAGSLFAAGLIAPPSQAHIGADALRVLGVGMVLLALGYVVVCAFARGRTWRVRGKKLHFPSAQLAVVQLALSAANWALMGAAMYLLLGQTVPYGITLGVLMAASIIGVIMPIPGGLGVIEAVYLALLSGSVRQGTLMGAVLAYRALYYLLPLAGGLVLYALLERYTAAHAHAVPAREGAG